MHLLLIRHAAPNRVESDSGVADPGLTAAGIEQAARLAAWLGDEASGVDHLYTSPLRRAMETAAPLADRFGLTPRVVDGLAEFDAGSSNYIPMEDLRAEGDERFAALVDGRWDELGSTVDPVSFRAEAAATVDGIAGAHPGERVAVVCHGAVINAYLGDVIGTPRLLWFEPRYTSISRVLVSRAGIRTVESVNESAHLR